MSCFGVKTVIWGLFSGQKRDSEPFPSQSMSFLVWKVHFWWFNLLSHFCPFSRFFCKTTRYNYPQFVYFLKLVQSFSNATLRLTSEYTYSVAASIAKAASYGSWSHLLVFGFSTVRSFYDPLESPRFRPGIPGSVDLFFYWGISKKRGFSKEWRMKSIAVEISAFLLKAIWTISKLCVFFQGVSRIWCLKQCLK